MTDHNSICCTGHEMLELCIHKIEAVVPDPYSINIKNSQLIAFNQLHRNQSNSCSIQLGKDQVRFVTKMIEFLFDRAKRNLH